MSPWEVLGWMLVSVVGLAGVLIVFIVFGFLVALLRDDKRSARARRMTRRW